MLQQWVTLDRGHRIAQPSAEQHRGRSHMAASDDVRKHSLQTPPMPDCPCLWLPSLMPGTLLLSPASTYPDTALERKMGHCHPKGNCAIFSDRQLVNCGFEDGGAA